MSTAMRYYTTFEAAHLLGVSLPTVVNWIKARRLKAHRTPGGHRRIADGELAAFMLRHGIPVPGELGSAAPERRKALVVGEPGAGREGAVRQLAASGYAVEQASPGFGAGAAAARFSPDVIVLHAPAPGGGECLRELKLDRELAETPVVAVGRAEWVDDLVGAGCAVALATPLAAGALADAVAKALAPAVPRGAAAKRTRARARRAPARRKRSD